MKKPLVLFLIYIFTLGVAAQEPTKMEQVVTLHDELMAKMPAMVKLIGKLQTRAQEENEKVPYEFAIEKLRVANKAMQDWMIGFGNRFDADEMMKGKKLTEKKQIWLEEEKSKIELLQGQIDSSIENAKGLLANE